MVIIWTLTFSLLFSPVTGLAQDITPEAPQKIDKSQKSTEGENKRCLDDICFNEDLSVGTSKLQAVGIGKYKFLFFSVYTAVFYALPQTEKENVFSADQPIALSLHYHRSLGVDDFVRESENSIDDNPDITKTEIASELAQMNAIYKPVASGDRYLLTYEPDIGTTLYWNGQSLGIIPGSKFAKAYFGIWISKYSCSASLTKKLLSGLGET